MRTQIWTSLASIPFVVALLWCAPAAHSQSLTPNWYVSNDCSDSYNGEDGCATYEYVYEDGSFYIANSAQCLIQSSGQTQNFTAYSGFDDFEDCEPYLAAFEGPTGYVDYDSPQQDTFAEAEIDAEIAFSDGLSDCAGLYYRNVSNYYGCF